LNDWYLFYPVISVGSYGLAGFIVFITTDNYGSSYSVYQFTNSFGCYKNQNPFNTTFVVGVSTSCSASKKVRRLADMTEETSETSSNTTAVDAPDPVCQNSRKPDTATVNGHDYNITDENRTDIMNDIMNLDATVFATKWQAVYRGPNTRIAIAPVEAQAKVGSS
jgi:hypothetical protein